MKQIKNHSIYGEARKTCMAALFVAFSCLDEPNVIRRFRGHYYDYYPLIRNLSRRNRAPCLSVGLRYLTLKLCNVFQFFNLAYCSSKFFFLKFRAYKIRKSTNECPTGCALRIIFRTKSGSWRLLVA